MKKSPPRMATREPVAKMSRETFSAFISAFRGPDNMSQFREMKPAERKKWESIGHRGRPPKPADEKSVKVMLSMPPKLLRKTDAYAKKVGMTRAGLVQAALLAAMRDRLKPAS